MLLVDMEELLVQGMSDFQVGHVDIGMSPMTQRRQPLLNGPGIHSRFENFELIYAFLFCTRPDIESSILLQIASCSCFTRAFGE